LIFVDELTNTELAVCERSVEIVNRRAETVGSAYSADFVRAVSLNEIIGRAPQAQNFWDSLRSHYGFTTVSTYPVSEAGLLTCSNPGSHGYQDSVTL
jgi:hypothetical protein